MASLPSRGGISPQNKTGPLFQSGPVGCFLAISTPSSTADRSGRRCAERLLVKRLRVRPCRPTKPDFPIGGRPCPVAGLMPAYFTLTVFNSASANRLTDALCDGERGVAAPLPCVQVGCRYATSAVFVLFDVSNVFWSRRADALRMRRVRPTVCCSADALNVGLALATLTAVAASGA